MFLINNYDMMLGVLMVKLAPPLWGVPTAHELYKSSVLHPCILAVSAVWGEGGAGKGSSQVPHSVFPRSVLLTTAKRWRASSSCSTPGLR